MNKEELEICTKDFKYFAKKYLKINNPLYGIIPFVLFPYQERLLNDYENNKCLIYTKFRQGEFSTFNVLYSFWKCLFKLDQNILFVTKIDRESVSLKYVLNKALQELPDFLMPKIEKNNDHYIRFPENNSEITFRSSNTLPYGGASYTHCFIEEAAFIHDLENIWKCMYPKCQNQVIISSTVNRNEKYFKSMYLDSVLGKNNFKIFNCKYDEHPSYCNPDWIKEMKEQLGNKGFMTEILQDFIDI